MRDLFLLGVENVARLLLEWAMRHRVVYAERPISAVVKEAWAPTVPESCR